jgi:hypothetical protein
MGKRPFRQFTKVSLLVALGVSTVALATPPFGIVLNQIVATGTALDNIGENLRVASSPNGDGENEDWQLKLRTKGATDFYAQYLVLAPAVTAAGTLTPDCS